MRKTLILLAALLAAGHLGQMAQAGNTQGEMVAPPVPRPDYRPAILPDAVLYKNIFSCKKPANGDALTALSKSWRTRR